MGKLLLIITIFLIASCTPTVTTVVVKEERPINPYPLKDSEICADLSTFPQSVMFYAKEAGVNELVIPLDTQKAASLRAINSFYAPWLKTTVKLKQKDAMWGMYSLGPNKGYAENLRPYPRERWDSLVDNSDVKGFPNALSKAITVTHSDLRVMPTNTPYFINPAHPGQSYPFDYYQNSSLPAGTPLLIMHLSKDKAWALVEGGGVVGWANIENIAYVDEDFITKWRSYPMAAIIQEKATLVRYASGMAKANNDDEMPAYTLRVDIGTILPYEAKSLRSAGKSHNLASISIGTLFIPEKDSNGFAVIKAATAPTNSAAPWPLKPTRDNIAYLADQIMGQPYGWGGYGFNRDCSSFMRELFLPFGLMFPRNSRAQAGLGRPIDLTGKTAVEKEQIIREKGAPFMTLIGMPGHIGLYLGQYNGRAAMMHNMWGLTTTVAPAYMPAGTKGRAVVGKAVITSLSAGSEREDLATPNGMLDKVNRITYPIKLE